MTKSHSLPIYRHSKYFDTSQTSGSQFETKSKLDSVSHKSKSKTSSNTDTEPHLTRNKRRPYAPPELYSDLNSLPDLLTKNLDIIFCGINPGCRSASVSHYYAHPTNRFWKCLYQSGLTSTLLSPQDDTRLPTEYGLGLTDLISRPTSEANELSRHERLAAVPNLLRKMFLFRPRFLCFVGLQQFHDFCSFLRKNQYSLPKSKSLTLPPGIQEVVLKYPSNSSQLKTNTPSLSLSENLEEEHKLDKDSNQGETSQYTFIFVTPSTSALVRNYQATDCFKFFLDLCKIKDHLISSQATPVPKPLYVDVAVLLKQVDDAASSSSL
ncbi:hypothetical protein CROQUDRAFT_58392 [Cronartium quercuum f. sp. fusiforme G11]|uniref:Uracil-DNA glycosylase-like domain-containing protein n=1 Tax=Cronartium quercuum f. sp. fusiforme G11 TaxID=708437 RepID=A0A9P6TF99_9BASI|nr:hypothetical protein CROQUDRAFT_58392 [Cronartium quercuum f. sp. fusiforme G11]